MQYNIKNSIVNKLYVRAIIFCSRYFLALSRKRQLSMLFHKFVMQTATRGIEIQGKEFYTQKSKGIRILHANPIAKGSRS